MADGVSIIPTGENCAFFLNAGDTLAFSYLVKITASKRNEIKGRAWLRPVMLNLGSTSLEAPVVVAPGLPAPINPAAQVSMAQPGKWNAAGKVKVYMNAGSLGEDGVITFNMRKPDGKGPAMQFELEAYPSGAISRGGKGGIKEQVLTLKDKRKANFGAPAFIEINLDGYLDLKNIPAGEQAFVAMYDETLKTWVKIPILETNIKANNVTVEAAHFSTWGAGLGSSLPQNGANVLLFDQPYTSLFTRSSNTTAFINSGSWFGLLILRSQYFTLQ